MPPPLPTSGGTSDRRRLRQGGAGGPDGGDDDGDGRLDLPEGGDGLLSRAKRASSESLEKTTGYKASKGKSAGKSYSKR